MIPKKSKGPSSVDGFTVRRRASQRGDFNHDQVERPGLESRAGKGFETRVKDDKVPNIHPEEAAIKSGGLSRAEVDESLNAVDLERDKPKRSKKRYRRVSKKKIALVLLLVALAFVGYFAYKLISTSGRVFSGNVFDLLGSGVQLKKDAKGWTNILVFGTSEDDLGHDGALLTDSIMMVSVHQSDKRVAMVSMPRDLWVDYGRACMAGYSGKINALYACGVDNSGEIEGANLLKQKVGEVFGVDMHYYTKVNYSLVRDLTTSLGGVTVNIKSEDPRGIYDYNTRLKLPNGPSDLQGEQALAFVRARGDGGGYGFEGSNFVREKNQQALILAIRDKSLSAGTLANPVAWNGILDAMGDNIRSDFSAAEIKTIAKLAEDIQPENITQISLVEKDHEVVTTGSMAGASIVRPISGVKDYSSIQKYIARKMNGGSDKYSEQASIQVLNASNKSGIAAKKQTSLEQAGFGDVTIGDTSYITPAAVTLYDMSSGKMPKTLAALEKELGVQSLGSVLPSGVQSSADFVILLGDGIN